MFQVSEASALKPQQYAQKRKQQQQQAMDSSPLHLACEAGFLEAVRTLLRLPQVSVLASVYVCMCACVSAILLT